MTETKQQSILEQLGGFSGLVYSTVPILVFVPVNAIWNLTVAIWGALGVAVAILLLRLWRREPIQPAISGFFAVGISAFIAHRTGDAKGYFLFGIFTSLAYGAVFLISILVRWPLVGVIWGYLNGSGSLWRKHRGALRAYDVATGAWVLVFASRYVVQSQLYDADSTGWLAVARIAMGWPLAGLALLVTIWAVRRADRLVEPGPREGEPDDGPQSGEVDGPDGSQPADSQTADPQPAQSGNQADRTP